MEVKLTLREEDYKAFRAHLTREVAHWSDPWVRWGVIVVYVGAGLVALARNWMQFGLGMLLGGALWQVLLGRINAGNERLTRRSVAALVARFANGPRLMQLGPEGIVVEDAYIRQFCHWRAVIEVVQTGNHVFLMVAPNQAHIVPRHAFAGDAEFLAFARQCREYFEAKLTT